MKVNEASAALERAGYVVALADGAPIAPGVPALYDVEGLGRDLTEGQLVNLAHRHGRWRPAFERAHGVSARPPE